MKAIETRYHGPTNTRGSRISARDLDGNRCSIPYDHAESGERGHAKAALALCKKMGWDGELIAGATKHGYVFVFVEEWTDRYIAGAGPRHVHVKMPA